MASMRNTFDNHQSPKMSRFQNLIINNRLMNQSTPLRPRHAMQVSALYFCKTNMTKILPKIEE